VLTRGRRTVEDDGLQPAAVGGAKLRNEFVECHARHSSPRPAGSTAAEAAAATESSESATTAKAAPAAETAAAPATTARGPSE
jgi:hypothetical protein